MKHQVRFFLFFLIAGFSGLSCNRTGPGDLSVSVTLRPMVPNDSVSVRWSPKGEKLALSGSGPEWSAELNLGPRDSPPVKLLLSAGGGSLYPDQLKGDWNRSGSLEDDSVIRIQPRESRGKIWSSFKGTIDIPVMDPQTGKRVINPYPLDFWYVYDPVEPVAEKVIRYSRRGWMQGSFEADTLRGHILLTEMQMDGIFDTLDNWMLALPGNPKELYGTGSRSCNDHAWLGNVAFRISEIDPSGLRVRLTRIDVGLTREQEAAARDEIAVDRQAAHSGRSVNFLHDYRLAVKEAARLSKPTLIDFETTWCGPCKLMDQHVYNADLVVEKSMNVVAVKVDGDDHRDLTKQFRVSAYPTIILVGADGVEIKRVVGYQSVKQMVEFLSI